MEPILKNMHKCLFNGGYLPYCETPVLAERFVLGAMSAAGLCVTRRNTPVSELRYGGGAGTQGPAS